MRLKITDINRINTCGYLKQNNWDYEKYISSNPGFHTGMKEILRWHYKRNRPVDPESFMTFISNLNNRLGLNLEEKIAIEKAFRVFVESEFYQNMTRIFMNYLTDIKISKDDYLENTIAVFQNNPSRPVFIYIEDRQEPKELFLQRFEVMHNAVWSFYHLNKNPTFIRIWFDGQEIKRDVFKMDDKYILKAKKHLITLGKNLDMFVLPTVQTCKKCSMITSCDRFVEKKKRGNNVETN
jgi:hypothetical protein